MICVNRKLWQKFVDHLKNELVATSLQYFLACLILPVLALILIIFILMKQLVYVTLKLRYRDIFGGFLESADAIWAVEDVSKSIINIVVTINFNKSEDVVGQIKTIIFHKIFKHSDQFPKLTSTRMRLMGFNYFLKDQITVDDCVSTFQFENENGVLSKFALQETISQYSNRPLPKQNSALWEILVSSKPVQCQEVEEQTTTFPILLRFSHIVGDGLSLTNLFLRTFTSHDSNLLQNYFDGATSPLSQNLSRDGKLLNLSRKVRYALKTLQYVLLAPSIILDQLYLRKEDVNSLHGPQLSGNKLLVYAIEREKQLISLVKRIKRQIPGSKFSDIVLTAISGSLENYFKHYSEFIPDFVTAGIPELLSPPNLNSKPILQNKFSMALLNLPISMNSMPLTYRLQEVMRQRNKLRKGPDYQVNYWLVTLLCGIVPYPLLRRSLNTDKFTMTISNVPGLPKLSILNGSVIENIVFFTPHRGTVGVGFTILTYDDRFQLGLEVDKSIISSADEAQSIVDGILQYIHLLSTELFQAHS